MSGITDNTDDGSSSDSSAYPDFSTTGALTNASTGINDGSAYTFPVSADTTASNAIQSMTPVDSSTAASSSGMSSFWSAMGPAVQDLVKVAAVKNGVTVTAKGAAPTQSLNNVVLVVGVLALAIILTHHHGG